MSGSLNLGWLDRMSYQSSEERQARFLRNAAQHWRTTRALRGIRLAEQCTLRNGDCGTVFPIAA